LVRQEQRSMEMRGNLLRRLADAAQAPDPSRAIVS
jgi:hypothetical protein